jgi:hypothetical protein
MGIIQMGMNRLAEGKTVFVRAYDRFRYGKWEAVTSHFRRPPSSQGELF